MAPANFAGTVHIRGSITFLTPEKNPNFDSPGPTISCLDLGIPAQSASLPVACEAPLPGQQGSFWEILVSDLGSLP